MGGEFIHVISGGSAVDEEKWRKVVHQDILNGLVINTNGLLIPPAQNNRATYLLPKGKTSETPSNARLFAYHFHVFETDRGRLANSANSSVNHSVTWHHSSSTAAPSVEVRVPAIGDRLLALCCCYSGYSSPASLFVNIGSCLDALKLLHISTHSSRDIE